MFSQKGYLPKWVMIQHRDKSSRAARWFKLSCTGLSTRIELHHMAGNGESPTFQKSAKRALDRKNIYMVFYEPLHLKIFEICWNFVSHKPMDEKIGSLSWKHSFWKSSQRSPFQLLSAKYLKYSAPLRATILWPERQTFTWLKICSKSGHKGIIQPQRRSLWQGFRMNVFVKHIQSFCASVCIAQRPGI